MYFGDERNLTGTIDAGDMSSTYGFGVLAYNCYFQVTTTCPEANVILKRYAFPWLPRVDNSPDQPDVSIRIDRVADEFRLLSGDVEVASADQAIRLVPDLIRVLDEAVVQRLTTLRAVHAGAVVWGGRALLLPGSSHAGKTSLVAELLRRGATYFSDEYALIDAEGRVHPYPRPLLMRNGLPEQVAVLATEYNATAGDSAVPVGWILALKYLPEGGWDIASIPQGEALLNLLRNTPHVLAETPGLVGIFQRAVAGAACYAGRRSDAADAVDQILQLIGHL